MFVQLTCLDTHIDKSCTGIDGSADRGGTAQPVNSKARVSASTTAGTRNGTGTRPDTASIYTGVPVASMDENPNHKAVQPSRLGGKHFAKLHRAPRLPAGALHLSTSRAGKARPTCTRLCQICARLLRLSGGGLVHNACMHVRRCMQLRNVAHTPDRLCNVLNDQNVRRTAATPALRQAEETKQPSPKIRDLLQLCQPATAQQHIAAGL